jgi:mRNA deadenylase 3'-5' endonuclease subunit Ccr4
MTNRTVIVTSYNTLADQYANNTPQGFVHVDPAVLEWSTRKNLLLRDIVSNDPDFIGLQEVDHWNDFFEPELRKLGYDGSYGTGNRTHGCALIWKVSNWKVLNIQYKVLTGGQVFIFGQFSSPEGILINVGTTHLKAKKFPNIRLEQGLQILSSIKDHLSEPIIFCGDFNADPNEPVCDEFRKYFTSAYPLVEDHYTTIKLRDVTENSTTVTTLFKRCIDYIWVNKLQVVEVVDLPKDIVKPYLPSSQYGSDHLAISAKLSL